MDVSYLVCKRCKYSEIIHEQTAFINCPRCKAERYAEYGDGTPVVVWSKLDDGKWHTIHNTQILNNQESQ